MAVHGQPVAAVIPHFNQSEPLPGLIKQLGEANYDSIYVLDDASTGEHRERVTDLAREHRGNGVHVLCYEDNVGAGQNRNRMLAQEDIQRYGDTILHFIDSDVTVDATGASAPDVLRCLLAPDMNYGLVGGLVRRTDGSQEPFNFGPSFTFNAFVGSQLHLFADAKHREGNTDMSRKVRHKLRFWLDEWPDTSRSPVATEPFWVHEANLAITASDLRDAGGFTPMRFHDVQGLAIGLAANGLTCRFDPNISVTHLDLGDHTGLARKQLQASRYLIKQYGLSRFLFEK